MAARPSSAGGLLEFFNEHLLPVVSDFKWGIREREQERSILLMKFLMVAAKNCRTAGHSLQLVRASGFSGL